jgi:endonuclease-8
VPEGDTIHHAARRVGAALVGHPIVSIATPHPRHRHDRWPERLADRAVRRVDAHGKHLFVRFEGDLTLHSHLRMGGKWGVYRRGERWRRSPHRAWLVIRTSEHEVVQFDGPVLELMTDGRTRFDQRLAALGPDIIDDGFDERAYLGRLREDDPTRTIGEALLDQRNVAGIGNIWKSEACFLAGVDPWRRVRTVGDGEALAIVRGARPLMRLSAGRGGRIVTVEPERPARRGENRYWVYDRAGLPCRRCAARIRARGQGDDNRTTFWCPSCQR